jgi:hypothetical protein
VGAHHRHGNWSVTEGLRYGVTVCVSQRRPDDPVAYLAMLLEQKAAAVAEGNKLVGVSVCAWDV